MTRFARAERSECESTGILAVPSEAVGNRDESVVDKRAVLGAVATADVGSGPDRCEGHVFS